MKRFTSFVLLLLFLTGNSFASVNIHYCGGEFQSISIGSKSKACGICGKKENQKSCCKDVQKLLKADDFSKVKHNFSFPSLTISQPVAFRFTVHSFYKNVVNTFSAFFDYLPGCKTPFFILFRSIRI